MIRDSNKSSTALRALHVLETLAASGVPQSASDVAEAARLDRATAYRMLRTLEEAGYVRLDAQTHRFGLTRKVIVLAHSPMLIASDTDLVRETLARISAATGETSHYSELDGQQTILTLRAKGTQLVAVDFQIGTRCPLHATSVGKAILAHQTQGYVERYAAQPMQAFTPQTLTRPDALFAELERIRGQNASYDRYELSEGMKCVAVPLRQPDGSVRSGFSISGPDQRFTDKWLGELVQVMAAEVARLETALRAGS